MKLFQGVYWVRIFKFFVIILILPSCASKKTHEAGTEPISHELWNELLIEHVDTSGWLTLLWATGRGELAGQEFLGESWIWHNDLLSEWEGNIPRLDG